MRRQLDQTERAIIRALQVDGRLGTAALTREVKASEVTVRKKLNALLDEGIISVKANANPYDLGFNAPCFIGMDVDRNCLEEVATQIAELPQVEMVAICNEYDLLVKVTAESTNALYDFIMHDLKRFPAIRDTQTLLAFKFFKHGPCRQLPEDR